MSGPTWDAFATWEIGATGNLANSDARKVFVTIILFDRNYNFLDASYSASSSSGSLISASYTVREPGYAYVYVSNEHNYLLDVYFDDVVVTVTPSMVVGVNEYYPFGLTINSYSRENATSNQNLYQGKDLQDELSLGTYDFQARMYDPVIGRTFQLDPLGEKFYDFSSYSWAANNPLRFIDPTGMKIEEGSQKEWDKLKQNVENRRDKLQGKIDKLNAKAEARGWSDEKLAKRTGNLTDRVSSLNSSLKNLGTLERSKQVYSLSHTGGKENGGVTLNTQSKTIDIRIFSGSAASFVHETTHAGQFESGDIAFDGKTGRVLAQDIGDEVAGYKAQFAYAPSSTGVGSFEAITPQWVQGLGGGNVYVPIGHPNYDPNVSANTGVSHLDINSTRADFIRAYPNYAQMQSLPANYTLRGSYPSIYYKK